VTSVIVARSFSSAFESQSLATFRTPVDVSGDKQRSFRGPRRASALRLRSEKVTQQGRRDFRDAGGIFACPDTDSFSARC
jgi:hypothetical protein